MLASRIFGLKTFIVRTTGEDELELEDEELSPRPGWARWCMADVQ